MQNIEIDKARMFIYNLLSLMFVEEYSKTKVDEIISSLEVLSRNSFSPIVEEASLEIIKVIEEKGKEEVYKEYQELFLIPFGTFIPLSVSWYHEQREGGIMQLKVKDVLGKTKIRRDEKTFTAQEDHLGFIFTLSAYLIEKQIVGEIEENLQKELFDEVIKLHLDKFFFKLMGTSSPIYSKIALILESFYGFEKAYLES
ncbi:TorD/DmsD family molecular chaperone [Arcobacter porcinus]|uniref:Putative formate dehydrogenase-specific chaperone n=1 Tax=Arcobacter porcinus TaxID=1935204 RepID=A0A1C0AZU0_9BACT|nr:molecular chaperone TorD family protein [Arcobacter porcinus]OCL96904.1 twin-argninine leader-binding protein DmsD [Aliarcobacter thereius]OCL82109.1 twin-argninine leader-binding protein DmsD [Arcobacter porcinus]OCL84969.1 twin-argninine leader-binding protein DmsD [Arcobacter porcinus]OCL86512.1 twin-argninine leader-binding protein DmsD [Arcobacter porcinus]OCL93154.1 twin-argninine leader-binding protein DmsD [Arcobacter porcinus]